MDSERQIQNRRIFFYPAAKIIGTSAVLGFFSDRGKKSFAQQMMIISNFKS